MWVIALFSTVSILALGYMLAAWRDSASTGILCWLTAAIVSIFAAVCTRPGGEAEQRAQRILPFLLTATVAMYAAFQLAGGMSGPRSDVALWLLVAGLVFLHHAWTKGGLDLATCRKRIFPLLLSGFLIVGVRTIRNNPNPHIDVFRLQQAAGEALTRLQDPYTATIPDLYGPASPYYIPMVKNGYTIYGFPYPPLIALIEFPSYWLLKDIRYTHLAAFIISAILIASMQVSWASLCAAVLLVVNPFSLLMVQYAWMEPIAILLLCCMLFVAVRRPGGLPFWFGLFLSSKQPVLALVPLVPLLIAEPWKWRRLAGFLGRSLAVVVLLHVPFLLWNRQAFVASLLTVQVRAPLRTDLISYSAYLVRRGWPAPSVWLPLLYLPVGLALGIRRSPRSPAGFAVAGALVLVPFFALSKQGAPNYYFLELGMMCCALALAAGTGHGTPVKTDEAQVSDDPAPYGNPQDARHESVGHS
jgi:hypothetical protein